MVHYSILYLVLKIYLSYYVTFHDALEVVNDPFEVLDTFAFPQLVDDVLIKLVIVS